MKNIQELNYNEIIQVNGGGIFIPLLVWGAKAAGAAVVGYFVYEAVDGVVRGIADEECSCE